LFLFCDTTTTTVNWGAAPGIAAMRTQYAATVAGGLAAGITQLAATTRWVTGLTPIMTAMHSIRHVQFGYAFDTSRTVDEC
jgi:hypothetical protein